MGWKDSGDAIVYPDGSLVKGPKALCELQGYVYSAWVRTPRCTMRSGKPDRARQLRAKAAALFERFNADFWDDELGFYALALDGEKRKVMSIASNASHCLLTGIVPPEERARKVVERLMAPDMWTDWGIRTLSAAHPAFNSYNYQTGSVWPHDNAIIALGFKLYGFKEVGWQRDRARASAGKAASHFRMNQLPELYTAFPRSETTFPVQYFGANVPQAWAAGSAFLLTQATCLSRAGRAEKPALRRSLASGMAARLDPSRSPVRRPQAGHSFLARGRKDGVPGSKRRPQRRRAP